MKKRVTIGVLLMAILMLAGCRPSTPSTETTDGITNEITNEMTSGQPDTTDARTEADTQPPELPDQTVALPYTVTTAHQAGDKIFTRNEWTGNLSPSIDGTSVRQTEMFYANRMAPHSSETLFYQSAEAARLGAVNYDYARSNYYQLLTGEGKSWQLAVYKNPDKAKSAGVYGEFHKPDYDMASAPKYTGDNTLAGIFRDVWLYSAPCVQLYDYTVTTDLDKTYTDATLSVSVDLLNKTTGEIPADFLVDRA